MFERFTVGVIVGTVCFLSLQAKGVSYCPPVPWAAIKEQQEDAERRKQEQRKLREIVKEIKKMAGITDENKEIKEISLPEAIALCVVAFFLFSSFRFLSNGFLNERN